MVSYITDFLSYLTTSSSPTEQESDIPTKTLILIDTSKFLKYGSSRLLALAKEAISNVKGGTTSLYTFSNNVDPPHIEDVPFELLEPLVELEITNNNCHLFDVLGFLLEKNSNVHKVNLVVITSGKDNGSVKYTKESIEETLDNYKRELQWNIDFSLNSIN